MEQFKVGDYVKITHNTNSLDMLDYGIVMQVYGPNTFRIKFLDGIEINQDVEYYSKCSYEETVLILLES